MPRCVTTPARRDGSSPARPPQPRAPLEILRERCARLAEGVEGSSSRGDVRSLRSRLLLLLLELRCPTSGEKRRHWYEPGAVARLGPAALLRRWAKRFPQAPPPSQRRLKDHLGALERALLLVRSPGEWRPRFPVPGDVDRPWPRFPDSLFPLEREEDAEFWSSAGAALLAAHPKARSSTTVWKSVFGDWRDRKKLRQRDLFGGVAAAALRRDEKAPVVAFARLARARALADVARGGAGGAPAAALAALEAAGVSLRGRHRAVVSKEPWRWRASAAILSRALRRGLVLKNASGYLVAVWKRVSRREADAVLAELSKTADSDACTA